MTGGVDTVGEFDTIGVVGDTVGGDLVRVVDPVGRFTMNGCGWMHPDALQEFMDASVISFFSPGLLLATTFIRKYNRLTPRFNYCHIPIACSQRQTQ